MRKATYTKTDGSKLEVEYDETAPCCICGLPVVSASVGGTAICPWCDCGRYRNGEYWTYAESVDKEKVREKAKRVDEQMRQTAEAIQEACKKWVCPSCGDDPDVDCSCKRP